MKLRTNGVRSISTVLVLCAIAPFAFAPDAKTQPLPDRASYNGRVLSENNLPIGGASVSLRRQNEVGSLAYWGEVLLSDARGNFVFPNAEAGTYLLSVFADGYSDIRDQPVVIGTDGVVAPIRLQELSAFRVRLAGSDAAPVKGTIFSFAMKPVEGLGRADAYWRLVSARTDGDGTAPFAGILPGRYDVLGAVAGAGYFEQKDVTFAPGKMAQPFAWQLKKGGTLKVATLNAAGKALGGVQISFTRLGDSAADIPRQFPGPEAQIYGPRIYNTRDGDGVLQLAELAPGSYKVNAVMPNAPAIASQTVAVEGNKVVDVKFASEPAEATSFSVKLVDPKDAPIANTDVVVALKLTSGAAAIKTGNAAIPPLIERRARTDANGQITLFPLTAGTWQISARREGAATQTFGAIKTMQLVVGENTAPSTVAVPDA